jgi:hypothetical protein
MRIVAHLISVLLLLPGIIVSVVMLAIGHLSAQGNVTALVTALLELALAFFPVAFALVIGWFALAVMGFSMRMRRVAAIGVGVIAAVTTAYMTMAAGVYDSGEHAGILVPGVCALVIAIWLASTDWAEGVRPVAPRTLP